MGLTIRPLEAEEAPVFHEFRLAALRECPEAYGTTYDEEVLFTPEQVASRIHGGDDFVLGAFDDDVLVGVVGLMRYTRSKRRHSAQVWGMYVAPEARRRGLGQHLMVELVERAKRVQGLQQLHLSVVTRCRAARRLYLAHGFESYGVEPRAHMQGDEWLDMEHMVLRLVQ